MLALALAAAIVGAPAAGVSLAGEQWLYLYAPLVTLVLATRGMYQARLRVAVLDAIPPVFAATSIAAMMVISIDAVFSTPEPLGPLMARAWLFATCFLIGGRIVTGLGERWALTRGRGGKPTLIVGAGVVGSEVAYGLATEALYGLRPVGFLDADPPGSRVAAGRDALPVLGAPDDLAQVASRTGAQHVVLAFSSAPDSELIPIIRRCEELRLGVSLVPRLFEAINERSVLEHVGPLPLLELRGPNPKGWQFAIKHLIDRVLAVIALLLCAPLLVGTALAIRLSSPGPVLFRQRRVGRDGTVFDLLKFRSMTIPTAAPGEFRPEPGSAPGGVEGEDRRTAVGRVIRRFSLDELPQLANVLRGQMSIVGPRPERPQFVEAFRADEVRYQDRHRVKSGITGWAQVRGLRGQTSLAERVEWDNFYIENWSLWLDLKIMLLTVGQVLRPGRDH